MLCARFLVFTFHLLILLTMVMVPLADVVKRPPQHVGTNMTARPRGYRVHDVRHRGTDMQPQSHAPAHQSLNHLLLPPVLVTKPPLVQRTAWRCTSIDLIRAPTHAGHTECSDCHRPGPSHGCLIVLPSIFLRHVLAEPLLLLGMLLHLRHLLA